MSVLMKDTVFSFEEVKSGNGVKTELLKET
jgi:hypothetical protein